MTEYKTGETGHYPCGCMWQKTEIGYTHFINPDCEFDNKMHPRLNGYKYQSWDERPRVNS